MSTAERTMQLVVRARSSPGSRSRPVTPSSCRAAGECPGRVMVGSAADRATSRTAPAREDAKINPVRGILLPPPNSRIRAGPAVWPSDAAKV
ncbi:hypothetical protein [Actinomadura nitritigenes]|uniref:hypothetical protein n=1 Tax=Actinomadura nitritigenes TaxID=134602 RepID=UPI003D8DFABD